MSTKKRWTKKEDKILVQLIEKNPHNLHTAFLMTSSKLERTITACQLRWYKSLRYEENFKNTFIITSKRKSMINGKNYIEGKSKKKPKKNKVSFWAKFLNLLNI